MLNIITTLLVLCLLNACKADDLFVVGGGPKPNTNILSAPSVDRDNNAAATVSSDDMLNIDTGTTSGLTNTAGTLAADLAGPILYATGDTLLLVGNTVNELGNTLPQPLTDSNLLLTDTIYTLEHTVDTVSAEGLIETTQDSTATGLVDGVLNTVNTTVSSVSDNNGLLGNVGNTIDGLTGSDSSGSDPLLGNLTGELTGVVNGTTDTVNNLTGSLTDGGSLLD